MEGNYWHSYERHQERDSGTERGEGASHDVPWSNGHNELYNGFESTYHLAHSSPPTVSGGTMLPNLSFLLNPAVSPIQEPNASLPPSFPFSSGGIDIQTIGQEVGGTAERAVSGSLSPVAATPSLPDEEICFGMLSSVEFQVKWPPVDDPPVTQLFGESETYLQMWIQLNSDHGLAEMPAGRPLAVMAISPFEALSLCKDAPGFRIDAWVLEAEWKDKVAEARKSQPNKRKIICMSVEMAIFGHRDAGGQIATALGRFKQFLQPPDARVIDCPYENPQSLQVSDPPPGMKEFYDKFLAARMNNETYSLGANRETSSSGATADMVDLITDIEDCFDKIPAHRSIAMASKDSRVLTPLFRHQQEALDFMIRREIESPSGVESALWELKTSPDGEDYYQNSVTGAKSRSAKDFVGGILADTMGLGKTLTTLALISSSLQKAEEFGSIASQKPLATGTTRNSKATMVIVPSELLLRTWANEIRRHLYPGSVRYTTYHGQGRHEFATRLGDYDIVLTTYGTVLAEHCREPERRPLHQIIWFRVILDEAHTIRNWSSKQFNAVSGISSHARWCLTGTPIQNTLEDLGSLIKFLRMPIFNDMATFRKYASTIDYSEGRTRGELRNLQLILSNICLRRNKTVLPNQEPESVVIMPGFTDEERRGYRNLELACKRAIAIGTKGLGDDKTHQMVMEALLRLRMFCNNGLAGSNMFSALKPSRQLDETLSLLQQSGEAFCAHCSVDILSIGNVSSSTDSGHLTPCGRLLCGECYVDLYRSSYLDHKPFNCPLCHEDHAVDNLINGASSNQDASAKTWPSKITAIVQNVRSHYSSHKCVIFSFWKTTLEILGAALEAANIGYLRVDGDVPAKKREALLTRFQTMPTSRVLLMTFSTGGVGLNGLTVADMVHIVEPQWNPAVEEQAIGRIVRLDQRSKVTIYRYLMQSSIEKVVQSRQFRKLQLARGGFLSAEEKRQLKSNQMQQLQGILELGGMEATQVS